jgi:tetratricopeptide (TPR) repeat protein
MEARRFEQAEEAFRKALDLRPHRNVAANSLNLGKACLAQKLYGAAVEALDQASAAGREEGEANIRKDALLLLGVAHLRRGRPAQAEQVLAEITDRAGWPGGRLPFDPKEIYRQAGALFLREGHPQQAKRCLTLSLRMAGSGREEAAKVMDICRRAGQEQMGRELTAAATAKGRPRLEELVAEAIGLVGRQEYAGAEDLYRRALDLEPDSGRVHFNLGKLYFRMERPRDGFNHLGLAVRWGLAARDWDLVLELAKVYQSLFRPAESRRLLEEILARLPDHRQAAQMLAALNREQRGAL